MPAHLGCQVLCPVADVEINGRLVPVQGGELHLGAAVLQADLGGEPCAGPGLAAGGESGWEDPDLLCPIGVTG